MQSYYEKYLKYKNKYTTLKNQKGGLMGGSEVAYVKTHLYKRINEMLDKQIPRIEEENIIDTSDITIDKLMIMYNTDINEYKKNITDAINIGLNINKSDYDIDKPDYNIHSASYNSDTHGIITPKLTSLSSKLCKTIACLFYIIYLCYNKNYKIVYKLLISLLNIKLPDNTWLFTSIKFEKTLISFAKQINNKGELVDTLEDVNKLIIECLLKDETLAKNLESYKDRINIIAKNLPNVDEFKLYRINDKAINNISSFNTFINTIYTFAFNNIKKNGAIFPSNLYMLYARYLHNTINGLDKPYDLLDTINNEDMQHHITLIMDETEEKKNLQLNMILTEIKDALIKNNFTRFKKNTIPTV
jgi:hypothetical protein